MTLTQYMDVIAERLGVSGLPDHMLTTYLEAFAANQGVDVGSLPDRLTNTYLGAILKARGGQSVSDNLVTTHLAALAETYGATNLPDRLVSTYLEAIIEGIASIPEEYETVEYIQSTGNQYINTGVVIEDLTSHYKFEMDLTVDGAGGETSTSNVNGYMGINGGVMLTLTKNNGLGISSSAGVPWVKGKRYSAVIERRTDAMRTATIDGTYFESSKQGTVYLDRPFGIYALSPFDGGFYTFYGKLYSFKAWKNNELIRHLVPCKRKSDGEVGVYDRVTKTFFTNAGTGKFTCNN